MAFQVTSPVTRHVALLPTALVLHVNPNNFTQTFNKKVERIQTMGGWVEQHWGDDLDEISAQGSTGAFMHVMTGTSAILRQRTIAWDRYRDFHDLYYNNGSVRDPSGRIVLQGQVMLMFDRGTYLGFFRTFQVEETADSPFTFNLSWSFKVQETILRLPSVESASRTGPQFQQQNYTYKATPPPPPPPSPQPQPITTETIVNNTSGDLVAGLSNAQLASLIIP
jgi:hypothetical protein